MNKDFKARNAITKKPYQGGNERILNNVRKRNGFATNLWLNENQLRRRNIRLKEGAQAIYLLRPDGYEVDANHVKRAKYSYFKVYNLDHTIGHNIDISNYSLSKEDNEINCINVARANVDLNENRNNPYNVNNKIRVAENFEDHAVIKAVSDEETEINQARISVALEHLKEFLDTGRTQELSASEFDEKVNSKLMLNKAKKDPER